MHPQITVDTARRLSHLDVLDREVAEITAAEVLTIVRDYAPVRASAYRVEFGSEIGAEVDTIFRARPGMVRRRRG